MTERRIVVQRPFKLNLGEAGILEFQPGTYDVGDAVADHWYTKVHAQEEVFAEPEDSTDESETEETQETAGENTNEETASTNKPAGAKVANQHKHQKNIRR